MSTTNATEVCTLHGHTGTVWSVAWNHSGTVLASCSADKTIILWSKLNGVWRAMVTLEDVHTRTIRRVAWSPTGLLAAASFDGTVSVWQKDDDGGQVCGVGQRFSVGHMWARQNRVDLGDQDVKSVLWHPNLELLVSTSYDDTMRAWCADEDDWRMAATMTGHSSTVWSAAFNSDGSLLASCSDDRSLRFWSFNPSDSSFSLQQCVDNVSDRPLYDVDWSSTNVLAVAAGDDQLRFFKKSATGNAHELTGTIASAHDGDVNCVQWNPANPSLLATAGDDNVVKLWQLS